MTDLKTLKQLVKLMVDADLTELDIEGDNEKVKLKRGRGGAPEVHYVQTPQQTSVPGPVAAGAQASPPQGGASSGATSGAGAGAGGGASSGGKEPEGPTISSPMVGTFYSSPTPDAKPFVAAGDKVTADTVVCIIEAMKVFNEIKAEEAGTIEKVLVQNGQAVEFGQPLFVIKPD